MKIFDSHLHIFTSQIIKNVSALTELVNLLQLRTEGAHRRLDTPVLEKSMQTAGVEGALMLPTAGVDGVAKTNRRFVELATQNQRLHTAGTLHPGAPDNPQALDYLRQHGVRFIKLCSFSQGFALDSLETLKMFAAIEKANAASKTPFAVVLDTLYSASQHFGTAERFTTTPKRLSDLAGRFTGINFIGAHMGGLLAPFELLRNDLIPRPNFYLDTSNAAHTLKPEQFVELIQTHGATQILFGTDWPWFIHAQEIPLIDSLLQQAGFDDHERELVFYGNMAKLMGI